jgi:hypothetical protein
MAFQVCAGANLACSFGSAPSVLAVLPINRVLTGVPAATIMDHVPMANIATFAMCNSPSNPVVAAATAAALGALTPMPCVPATATPWVPGDPKVTIGGQPAIDSNCKVMCMWGGVIQVVAPGETVVIDA